MSKNMSQKWLEKMLNPKKCKPTGYHFSIEKFYDYYFSAHAVLNFRFGFFDLNDLSFLTPLDGKEVYLAADGSSHIIFDDKHLPDGNYPENVPMIFDGKHLVCVINPNWEKPDEIKENPKSN